MNLNRLIPGDFHHVEKYSIRAIAPETISVVESMLSRRFSKQWRVYYDQLNEGACVGFGESEAMTYYNRVRYDARWLWNEAKRIDEWSDTNPGDNNGTSLRAGFDVLRTIGHKKPNKEPNMIDGIEANRWCTTVDEIRTAIASGDPVVMGTDWYSGFDKHSLVEKKNHGRSEMFINTTHLDVVRGGHCFTFFDASDEREAFRTPNSWGIGMPQVWFPYMTVEYLLNRQGEAGVITDR